jgi:hypothetical protein
VDLVWQTDQGARQKGTGPGTEVPGPVLGAPNPHEEHARTGR